MVVFSVYNLPGVWYNFLNEFLEVAPMQSQFSRTELLLGSAAMERLQNARVAVFGIGGVGGYAVEALARSGIGTLDLFDHDTVSLTNLNRQIIATHDTIGMLKVDAAKLRIHSINPNCTVHVHPVFYLADTAEDFDFSVYDYIIDAIDTVTGKLLIIQNAIAAGVPVISCMGTGNKLDASALQVADISKTTGCPLARIMRKELRKRGIDHLKVVYSTEEALTPVGTGEEAAALGKRSIPGSTPWVPGVAGLILAGEVIQDLSKSQ
jgi:tRNA A37 threonylcarbamoyladenosine dehydratase